MEQTPINYWYCPQCECEVDSRNVTKDEKHDNCGTEVESRQHVQTPIEKAISEFTTLKNRYEHGSRFCNIMSMCITKCEELLPYEKTYHRNIAEKAWDAAKKEGYSIGDASHPDKQTYLNKNHPL